MAKLTTYSRSPHSPSPIYGIRPGFTVGDLDRAYTPAIPVLFGTLYGSSDYAGVQSGYINTQQTITATGTVQPNARAVKISVNVSGTGSIILVVKSNVDSYATTIATYGTSPAPLIAGAYNFYLGGYGSPTEYQTSSEEYIVPEITPGPGVQGGTLYPTSDGTKYVATQYGPVKKGSTPDATNPTGDEETVNPDTNAYSNYVGGTYNPFQFLSLDGYSLQFTATVTGTVGYDVEVSPIS